MRQHLKGLLVSALCAAMAQFAMAGASARAESQTQNPQPAYPDWTGQWIRFNGPGQWDPSKPGGRGQQAPLTPEYLARLDAGVIDQNSGGQGINNATPSCLPPGMPRVMIVYEPMEIIVTPATTYVLVEFMEQLRRIYTDGRDWPDAIKPSFNGYSIGHWQDDNGSGRYNALAVETRGMRGPRSFDGVVPLHDDNATIVKERIYLDPTDANVLHDQITTIDHALTAPWTVIRNYRRATKAKWFEYACEEANHYVLLGKDYFFVSEDGYLMPTKKGQPPPDMKFFDQPAK
jgi:hypothetical protein